MGVARPIWSAEGEAVCLSGPEDGSQRTLPLLTCLPELQRHKQGTHR